jgi:hypothetical protein
MLTPSGQRQTNKETQQLKKQLKLTPRKEKTNIKIGKKLTAKAPSTKQNILPFSPIQKVKAGNQNYSVRKVKNQQDIAQIKLEARSLETGRIEAPASMTTESEYRFLKGPLTHRTGDAFTSKEYTYYNPANSGLNVGDVIQVPVDPKGSGEIQYTFLRITNLFSIDELDYHGQLKTAQVAVGSKAPGTPTARLWNKTGGKWVKSEEPTDEVE